jgi:hypothetical protein
MTNIPWTPAAFLADTAAAAGARGRISETTDDSAPAGADRLERSDG